MPLLPKRQLLDILSDFSFPLNIHIAHFEILLSCKDVYSPPVKASSLLLIT